MTMRGPMAFLRPVVFSTAGACGNEQCCSAGAPESALDAAPQLAISGLFSCIFPLYPLFGATW